MAAIGLDSRVIDMKKYDGNPLCVFFPLFREIKDCRKTVVCLLELLEGHACLGKFHKGQFWLHWLREPAFAEKCPHNTLVAAGFTMNLRKLQGAL